METRIGFLVQLEKDVRAAAARERLAIDRGEPRGTSPVPGLGDRLRGHGRRGRGGRRRWLVASAAALSLLVVAGSVGFLATGGIPLGIREDLFGDEAAPASGGAFSETASAGGGGSSGGNDGAMTDRGLFVQKEALRYGSQYDAFALQPGLENASSGSAPAPVDVASSPRQLRDLSKIVRTGRVGIVVENGRFEPTADRIRAIAEANEGFVQESSTRTRIGNFVLRVPSRRFDPTVTALGELGTVEFQSQRSDDVTAEFVDNKARLEILLERREVLRGFLREADTTAETLRFFNAVQEVQLDIERLQGSLAFLNDQVSISTINVRLRERDAKAPQIEPVDNPSIGHAFDRAIAGFLNVVGAVVIGLGYLLPVLVIGAIAFVATRLARRRRQQPPAS